MAVLYGEARNVDWVRNVMQASQCVLKTRGEEYVLERPEMIPASHALAAYPPLLRWVYRARGIHEFLWAHRRQSVSPHAVSERKKRTCKNKSPF